jgi:hypothetical protein
MDILLNLLANNAAVLSLIGSALAFAWSVVQFVLVRKRDEQHREFEIYHRLVKELVAPDPDYKATWINRQATVVFELRRFKRYHELTLRTLLGLREKWTKDADFTCPRLMEELDLTVDYLLRKSLKIYCLPAK